MQIKSRFRLSSIAITSTIAIAIVLYGVLPVVTMPTVAWTCAPPAVTTCTNEGFMTGGGRFNGNINNAPAPNPTIPILVHGFILHCNAADLPNNLEINWKDPSTGVEHQFHLDSLYWAQCQYVVALGSPNPPDANFNLWVGNGTGRLDGTPGAFIYAQFSDQSQPAGTQAGGPGDWSTIVIYSPTHTLVLQVTDSLFGGAQQSHMCHSNC